jgi:hypothetical protein
MTWQDFKHKVEQAGVHDAMHILINADIKETDYNVNKVELVNNGNFVLITTTEKTLDDIEQSLA